MEIEDEKDIPKEDYKPKNVGRGLRAQYENPEDQQWYLADSEHPYAPFPGNALKWESFVYDDGTTYEGLARESIPHGKGVMTFGNGTGGGIQLVEPGDRYEGEFYAGFANGLGSYSAANGEVYRGEWLYGKRHGCGAVTSFAPYFRELKKGTSPDDAWRRTRNTILNKRMRYGRWERNRFQRDISDDNDDECRISDVRGILQEMESVVTKARMFQHKPDGDVTHVQLRDKQGVPIPVFQDPLHYPHGTKFLAPGPLGQCHPVPDNKKLRSEMLKHARNYMRIYSQYNLPYLAKPGDDMFAAARLQQIQDLKAEHYRRIAMGEDEEAVLEDLDKGIQDLKEPNLDNLVPEDGSKREKQSRLPLAPQEGEPDPAPAPAPAAAEEEESDGEIDEDDLVASTCASGAGGRQGAGSPPPSVFCSISSGSGRLRQAVRMASTHTAHFLPRVTRKQPLGRHRALS